MMNPEKQILCTNCGQSFLSSEHGSFKCPACAQQEAAHPSDVGHADQCLWMIKKELEVLGIQMDSCPPMFYPEAIRNLFTWTALAARDCVVLHRWHDKNIDTVVRCIREAIVRRQGEPASSQNQ